VPAFGDTAAPVDLFASAVREDPLDLGLACSLIGLAADAATDVRDALSALDAFAALARPLVPSSADPAKQAEGLRIALGEHAGFAGYADDYADLRSSLLPEVLRRRRGLPILLAVVWVEVARRVGLAAYPVALPGHVVVGIGDPAGRYVLVDPFRAGRPLSGHDAAEIVRASGARFHTGLLAPAPPAQLLLRVLANIRRLAADTDDPHTRLWAVRFSLAIPDHPAVLRRELGEVLGRLGDFVDGARQLEAYADAVAPAEPAAAEAARRNANMLRARLN
jgi:regulator of sirC expression with transglutaminase-like and TPR domain